MTFRTVRLPDGRIWLRVADPSWVDPLDSSFAQERGGRWNPPVSHRTLYLNGDVRTARAQIERTLEGFPVRPSDLDDDAFVLVAATLPRSQLCADAVTGAGLRELGLPETYPLDGGGRPLGRARCQQLGRTIHGEGLRGVWCRSAATSDGLGRELAWFPAGPRSVARPIWPEPLPYGAWRNAAGWGDIGMATQADP